MKKICIIGSGIAGISAAVNMAAKGYGIDLYEAAPVIGGRISSFKDSKTGDVIDNGQHLLTGAYHNFLHILKELGTVSSLKWQNGLDINYIDKDKNNFNLNTGSLPGDLGHIYGILKFYPLNVTEKYNLIKFALKIKTNNLKSNETCFDFLKRNKQSDNTILYFWEPLILATINNSIKEAPAQLLINILKDAFFKDQKSSSLILPETDLKSLIEPLENYLNHRKSQVFTSAKVSEILVESNEVKGIRLKKGKVIEYDKVICAVPPYALRKILPEDLLNERYAYLNEFEFSPILSVYLWYSRRVLNEEIYTMIGTDTQWIFNKSMISGRGNDIPALLSITISNADKFLKMPPNAISNLINNELTENIPSVKKAKLVHSRVIMEKMATFRADLRTEKMRPANSTSINGLYIAGDWTDTGYPATIEGAAISGLNAANLLARDFQQYL